MKRFVDVHMCEVMAGKADTILHSDANNACLVIAAYDANHKVGGLAHAMFVSEEYSRKLNHSYTRDAGKAIDEMIQDMELLGSKIDDIEVCLVTGENVPHEKGDTNYQTRINSAIELLKRKRIKFKQQTTTEIGNKHVSLDVSTGRLIYA
ncbi:MAG: hypothetical protein A2Y03_04045 [Omnitrophica WOR_2 bacterium GWF2_38_59]|nr:MAG: hypothetical protein A2Y06_06755 [Omnitrophica WOR_2 bacterium GWA2_37_7]OGX25552.1 MAG: hypothetical protein A2Y03_04045 [Omnitrophica WOR_2 bacterium GWF2_38_59]OGX50171.1 MAG: hypothetical protein A2243_08525 [Omnitrophica WOR_2 bacterium RIFOXYA2_FULL_38_17]OGX52797.1 MAG: hypothetical protein A2267_07550 [Omnitrophica WOR_2 bacterium RIFOXYA12_FULL_38_10]OGX57485.1 MAG: hypothetical protein A2447_03345 [Omnitrophica WOR_2 bacterium RIFOXYC2_FULL_38_12]OGX59192.1 MAG: hypothetical 